LHNPSQNPRCVASELLRVLKRLEAQTRGYTSAIAAPTSRGSGGFLAEYRTNGFVRCAERSPQAAKRATNVCFQTDGMLLFDREFARSGMLIPFAPGSAGTAALRSGGDDHGRFIMTQARDRSPSLPPDRRRTWQSQVKKGAKLGCGATAATQASLIRIGTHSICASAFRTTLVLVNMQAAATGLASSHHVAHTAPEGESGGLDHDRPFARHAGDHP